MDLQDQIDAVDRAITATAAALEKKRATDTASRRARKAAREHLRHLAATHDKLQQEADALYASLNLGDKVPVVDDVGVDFMKQLLITADSKRVARTKIIARLREFDRIDSAIGGTNMPLGALVSPAAT